MTAAPVDVVSDWPEWPQWLDRILEVDARCSCPKVGWTREQYRQNDNAVGDLIEAAHELEEAMASRPPQTDRQEFAVSIWHLGTGSTRNSFDMTNILSHTDPLTIPFLKAVAPRYARLLPEVPFVFPRA